jgi:predicted RNA-binding Zn-ribbon protein involved in translation (DUF1610 family)
MGFGRRFRELGQQVQRLQQQAVDLHAQGQALQQAHDPTSARWDPVAWLPPPSEFVKRGTCTSCGAPKQLPTVREYLYCDFCGQLTDYDLRRAAEAAVTSPTITAYAEVANRIGPELERVRKRGDRPGFEALQRQLQAAQAELTPLVVPPRAWNDARYRQGWVDFTTAQAVLAAFDPQQQRYADDVRNRSLRLQWHGGMGLGAIGGGIAAARRIFEHGLDPAQMTPKAVLSSFMPLAEVVLAQTEHLLELIRREGVRELDPDRSSDELIRRMTRSALAQGWLKHLQPDDGQAFIEWLGLRHEYQRATVTGDRRSCGGCGHPITTLPGATRVVCDACGRVLDVSIPQTVCTGCNAAISWPEGLTHQQCPYCQAEVRRV